jgi:hypothetical protein
LNWTTFPVWRIFSWLWQDRVRERETETWQSLRATKHFVHAIYSLVFISPRSIGANVHSQCQRFSHERTQQERERERERCQSLYPQIILSLREGKTREEKALIGSWGEQNLCQKWNSDEKLFFLVPFRRTHLITCVSRESTLDIKHIAQIAINKFPVALFSLQVDLVDVTCVLENKVWKIIIHKIKANILENLHLRREQ